MMLGTQLDRKREEALLLFPLASHADVLRGSSRVPALNA